MERRSLMYIDASRLHGQRALVTEVEVGLNGMVSRLVLTVNGRAISLKPTGEGISVEDCGAAGPTS